MSAPLSPSPDGFPSPEPGPSPPRNPGGARLSGLAQTVGILMLVFAGLGLLESGAQVFTAAMERPREPRGGTGSFMDMMLHGDPRVPRARQRVRLLAGLSGLAVGALHLAAGLALLAGGRAARSLRLGFAILAPLRALVVIFLSVAWLAHLQEGGLIRGPSPPLLAQVAGFAALSAAWAIACSVLLRRPHGAPRPPPPPQPSTPGA